MCDVKPFPQQIYNFNKIHKLADYFRPLRALIIAHFGLCYSKFWTVFVPQPSSSAVKRNIADDSCNK